jgi:cytochrome c-type biogenesis protein CcmH
MTQFWIYAAGLMVLAMAFFVLPILLQRKEKESLSSDELNLSVFKQQLEELDNDLQVGILDQDRYDAARKDLEKELLIDVNGDRIQTETASSQSGKWIMSVSVMIPMLALLFYQALGSPEIIQRLAEGPAPQPQSQAHHAQQGGDGMQDMVELVEKLAARLEEQPENLDGWMMLGRSYMAMNQPQKAIAAYERALQISDQHPKLLLAYAEALGMMNGKNFTGKPAELIKKAYSLNPEDPNGVWMMGIVSYQRGAYEQAITHWEQAKVLLGPENASLDTIDNAIGDAREQLGQSREALPSIVQAKAPIKPAAAADAKSVAVEISLAPELSAKAKPTDLVFIYAKALSGPPMPLAAARKQVKDLPLKITLDDSMAMMPQMRLSAFDQVIVGARVSLSGNPSAQSGDLEGEVKPVTPGQSEPVLVTINSVHP